MQFNLSRLVKLLKKHLIQNPTFLKYRPNPPSFLFIFVLFSHCKEKYSTNLTVNDKSVNGGLGSRTWGGRMESADESTELWRHPTKPFFVLIVLYCQNGIFITFSVPIFFFPYLKPFPSSLLFP